MGLGSGEFHLDVTLKFSFLLHLRRWVLILARRFSRQSFHFAPRLVGETFEESILRAEYYLALRTNIRPDSKVLDLGCGVGGPLRNIQQFTGADITGVTINEYQVRVGNRYCAQRG
eukprot:665980_1